MITGLRRDYNVLKLSAAKMSAPRILCVLFVGAGFCVVNGDELALGESPFTVLIDTRVESPIPLTQESFAQRGRWTLVPPDTTDYEFAGDAVLTNDRLAAVARRQGVGIELYALGGNGPSLRAVLLPAGGDPLRSVQSVTIRKNAEDGVELGVVCSADGASGLSLELALGQIHVKTQPLGTTKGVRVEAPCRFSVMPDFFADDIVLDARSIPLDRVEQPSENLFVQMVADGNAMVMSVWENRDQDVTVNLSGAADMRTLDSVEIAYGSGDAVWVAILNEPGVWHQRDVTESDLGVELPLEWRAPYEAIWRVDWHRTDGLTDSWEMIVEQEDGSFTKPDLFEEIPEDWAGQDWWSSSGPRARWNTALGRYLYPAWFDKQGAAYLQPLKQIFNWSTSEEGEFHPLPKNSLWVGPALIFPVDRTAATPLDRFSITDVVRNTLGVGPCQYILDVEGQKARFQGRPTCDTRDLLNDIYENRNSVESDAEFRREEVVQIVDDVLTFIRLIRSRIEAYRQFGQEMETYLEHQKQLHPELGAFFESMSEANRGIAHAIANREEGIQSIAYAEGLARKFHEDVLDYNGPDALDRCKAITEGWVHMGDNQDELVAECRVAVKVLRQRAIMASLTEPAATDIAREIRERTQAVLRSPVSYEGARH